MTQLASLLGTNSPSLGRYVNGLSYPTLQMMQKFEYVFGWPIAEQVELIPPYWEWPPQIGRAEVQATDMRYGYKLRKIMKEWAEANPRTVKSGDVRMHPSLKAVQGIQGGRAWRTERTS
jgi:hypothetical protein